MYARCPGTDQYATNVRESHYIPNPRGGVLAWYEGSPESGADMGVAADTRTRAACRHCRADAFELTDQGTPRFHHLPLNAPSRF